MNNKPVHPGGFGATNGFRQLGQTPVGLWGAEAPPTHTRPPATGLSSTPVTPGEAAAKQRCHEAAETAPVSLVKSPAQGGPGAGERQINARQTRAPFHVEKQSRRPFSPLHVPTRGSTCDPRGSCELAQGAGRGTVRPGATLQ